MTVLLVSMTEHARMLSVDGGMKLSERSTIE
jgi:hypothetical protein